MKIRQMPLCGLIAGLLTAGGPAFAHHGTNASYDITKHITLTGIVTEFVWANPHMQLYFDVKDDKGNVVHWSAEIPDPPYLAQKVGWERFDKARRPGDCHGFALEGGHSRHGPAPCGPS